MGAEVESQKYQGVNVDHPRIVEATRNLLKQGVRKEEIVRIIGMPREVIDRIERETKR